MSLSTYAGLQTFLVDLINDQEFTSAKTVDLITLAEARVNKEIRHRHMETALSGTMSSGLLTVPSDYVELKHARIANKRPFKRKTAEWIYENYPERSATGVPLYIARDAGNFIFSPQPDSNYAVVGVYYKRFGALSSAVNDLFTAHPDLYLFAALCETEPFRSLVGIEGCPCGRRSTKRSKHS
jgi:hypothetical protein